MLVTINCRSSAKSEIDRLLDEAASLRRATDIRAYSGAEPADNQCSDQDPVAHCRSAQIRSATAPNARGRAGVGDPYERHRRRPVFSCVGQMTELRAVYSPGDVGLLRVSLEYKSSCCPKAAFRNWSGAATLCIG
jgi:hypothetical protein